MVSLILPRASMPITPPPPRPISIKRDSSFLDGDMSPIKRLKVAFNEDIDVRILDECITPPQDLVQEEVRLAIDGHLKAGASRDDTAYEQLRAIFAGAALQDKPGQTRPDGFALDRPSSALLMQYLAALLKRVGHLKACPTLVYTILDINWFGRTEEFVSLYIRFIGAYGTVVQGFLKPCIEKILRHFVSLPSSYGRIPGASVVRKRQMLANLHFALRYLIGIIPAATNVLAEAIKVQFPNHRMVDQKDFLAYVRNLFRITTYAPELISDVLSLVTERLVKIDVDIQQEIEDLEDDVEEDMMESKKKNDNYFLDDDTSDDEDVDSDTSSDIDESPEERQLKSLRDRCAKLDAGMDFLFKHYSTTVVADNSNVDFDQLLALFNTFVMPTYRSRHVQFLTFHFAQLDSTKTARFISRCLTAVQSQSSSSSVFGAAYLASFIARGTKVPRSLVRDVTSFLIQRIDSLRSTSEMTARGPDIGRYPTFYASCQALLYIFCFRWRELLFNTSSQSTLPDDDFDYAAIGDVASVPGLRDCLHLAIHSRLNPLKVCSSAIVKQFAAISFHLKYLFLQTKLETNKKVRLSGSRTYGGAASSAGSAGAAGKRENALSEKRGEAHHQLDAFFPFDPYHLPRSRRWLEGDYSAWRQIQGMKGFDDDDEDDSEEEEDDEEGYDSDDSI